MPLASFFLTDTTVDLVLLSSLDNVVVDVVLMLEETRVISESRDSAGLKES